MSTLGQQRPWTLIESDDPTITLAEGIMSDWPTLIEAAGALVRSTHEYRAIVYDDDTIARELDDYEHRVVDTVCACYGLDVLDA